MNIRKELKERYNTLEFQQNYIYNGKDLGAICTEEGTSFLLWSPLADTIKLRLYQDGEQGTSFQEIAMQKEEQGVWSYKTEENLHGIYYDYERTTKEEKVSFGDPYARACGVNGIRSMVVDLEKTNPDNWENDQAPKQPKETVIYELHIKEFSWDKSGGFPKEVRGKYKAFLEENTTLYNEGTRPTGISYLKKLGITHVQLMPTYDYGSVDETNEKDFNWGYDPVNYNVPEGSYASDAKHGEVRIREFKEMIQSLHKNGFHVIMDVVYNHMYSLHSNLNQAVPWYYYRTYEDGTISNGSACGNDMASERAMCANYILDSILYWVREYHIDGFRFDLMGLLDVDLMNRIRAELDNLYGKGKILLFGEPWAADQTALEGNAILALKDNIGKLDQNIGMFCDDTRDCIKGDVFKAKVPGFVNGSNKMEQKIQNSVKAWCVNHSNVKAPSQIITYVSAHDNWTLWDKLGKTIRNPKERIERNKLAAAIYMTCQGTIFFLSGEEFARTKNGLENTYNNSIELNRIDWNRAYEYEELREYYEGLIALRKQLYGLCDKSENAKKRIFRQWKRAGVVGFCVDNEEENHASMWKTTYVLYNSTKKPIEVKLPEGEWELLLDKESSFHWKNPIKQSKTMKVAPISAVILGKRN